ncbi:DNA (cytosine-5-)-methyltransferase [Arthrobacter sp. FW305-BF8]|uniref:DNA (cytosine-5-)-methyltransferase n=1 Tax=Arthrobacter sp. FW305-BF8 TaxID=2879617 RepID=UPI0023519B1F|nr:DNA (cytosine-5-)-methyltransferase [Arthrobacter sp. FW305-BF8]
MQCQTPASRSHLDTALSFLSRKELADYLRVDIETIVRWTAEGVPSDAAEAPALDALISGFHGGSTGRNDSSDFTFIDLFAGIGGIRTAFEAAGGRCILTSEWNKFSQKTYAANHGVDHAFIGDITDPSHDIPYHDVLLAGFPCQPFSIAGVSKKNSLNRPHGFSDPTQGTLFFEIKRILKEQRPSAFLLENVKNLRSHDGGNTFRIIMNTLQHELGYEVHSRVIDGAHFTPQHRERIVIVGFAEATSFSWDEFHLPEKSHRMRDILHKSDGSEPFIPSDGYRYFDHERSQVPSKYTLTPGLWEYLQQYSAKHKLAGNGFGYGLVDGESTARTLSARYYKDGSEILVAQEAARPRRLTPRECARLMGFPDSFVIPVSDMQAYKQFGNSVVVPVFAEAARAMKPHIAKVLETRTLARAATA